MSIADYPTSATRRPPSLVTGDRLTRQEFERRYHAMPGVKKAQLIEGIVRMPSPVHFDDHSVPHALMVMVLMNYHVQTPNTQAADNPTVRLDDDNCVQPDALLRYLEAHGGSSKHSSDDYLEGPPELVVEIAGSSAAEDLRDKLNAYRRNGVKEYVVWITYDDEIRFHRRIDGDFTVVSPDDKGVIKSEIFPGLWLDIPALLARDGAKQLATLQRGISSR
jgi:Uma2 family endonuclease